MNLKDVFAKISQINPVVNGVDNPNVLSVDSTTPIETETDELKDDEESGTPKVDTEKKEVKSEEASPTKEKPAEEKKEEPVVESKDAVQKRINALVKKQRTAERERDWERAERLKLQEENEKLKGTIPADNKPKRDDFVDDEAYLEALTDWKVDQKLKVKTEVSTKVTEEEADKQAAAELYEIVDNMVEAGREKYSDFDTIALNKEVMITQDMTEALLETSIAHDIMYYLGKNPDIAADISKMSPLKAAKEIAKIEAELSKPADEEVENKEEKIVPEPKKKIPKAPPPITPVKAAGVTEADPSKMSPKEYRAWRERNKE